MAEGFKIVQFSPELVQVLTQMGETRGRMIDYIQEEFRRHKVEEKLDHRDFIEMMDFSAGKSEEESREYVRNFLGDYISGDPERRKKCLDDFYDRDDGFNPANLDLSCLKGTDTGPREPGGLTGSERDFLSLISAFRREQALNVKLEENPGYAEERYGAPRARAEFEARRTAMMNGLISYTDNMLRNNGFNERLDKRGVAPMVGDGECVAADLSLELYSSFKNRIEGRAEDSRLRFALAPENGNLYGLQRQLAGGSLTKEMKNNAAAAFDASLSTLYRANQPVTTMQELGTDALDLIHVDGLSARERYGNKYADLSEWEQNKMMKAEVMGAIMEGRKVDAVTMELGPRGRMRAVSRTLEVDLHAYDQMEKRKEHGPIRRLFDWGPGKIRTRADNIDRRNERDGDRRERTARIADSFAPRLEALESRKLLQENLGMSQKPPTRDIQIQEQRLKAAEDKIRAIEKRNLSGYEEIGRISGELAQRKVYEESWDRLVHKVLPKLETTKAVKDDGNLMETDIREVMDPVLGHFRKESRDALSASYEKDFQPGFYKINELRVIRDMSREELEARRDTLTAALGQGQKKDEYRLEAVTALINAQTPQEREQVISDIYEQSMAGAREHMLVCVETMSKHPAAGMTPEQIRGSEKRIQELENGLSSVPGELLKERAEEEARLNQMRELNGEDVRPEIIKFGQAERLHPDYVPPATKEEAMARISDLDAKYGPEIRYLDQLSKVRNFRAMNLSDIDENKPYWAKEQAAMTLRYMDGMTIDTSGLDERHKQMLAEGRAAMEQIAGARAGTISLEGSNARGLGIGDAYAEALKTDPACARAGVKGRQYAEGFSEQWELRQMLMDDLKELIKKEPVLDAEKEKAGGEKEKAEAEKEKAGGEKEKAEAEKEKAGAEKEKAGGEKEKAGAEKEKAGAEKEKAGAEKEKAEAEKEKAGAEKEKAGPEKTEVQRNGKKEVAFETLELSEKEAGGIKKPESPWVRHTLSPFHKDSGPSLPGDRGIGSHRSNNRQSSK